jgi:hypothetical protein
MLSDVANGNVTVSGQRIGDTATYTCDDGFELTGSGDRSCGQLTPDTNDWSPPEPACVGK